MPREGHGSYAILRWPEMSPGATFERIYRAIKLELGSGHLPSGEPLEPAILATRLSASVTPVRDALHRLVGERLVESPRRDGFRTPVLTELGLRHLYRWNGSLLALAVRSLGGARPLPLSVSVGSTDPVERTEGLFDAITACAGNAEHFAAVAALHDRLRPVRRAEARLLGDLHAELHAIAACLAPDQAPALRRTLALYHRRREKLAPDLVAALQAGG